MRQKQVFVHVPCGCKCKYYRQLVLCVTNVALDKLFYCYIGLQEDNNITSQTDDLYYLTSQQQQVYTLNFIIYCILLKFIQQFA